jgi:hypothetical protein
LNSRPKIGTSQFFVVILSGDFGVDQEKSCF